MALFGLLRGVNEVGWLDGDGDCTARRQVGGAIKLPGRIAGVIAIFLQLSCPA